MWYQREMVHLDDMGQGSMVTALLRRSSSAARSMSDLTVTRQARLKGIVFSH